MRALETRRLVPGQRLIETELALRFGVGRNAVREALQWLAAQGVTDVIRHRSSAIRRLDEVEALEVLDVADAMLGLVVRAAAERFDAARDEAGLTAALHELEQADDAAEPGGFDRARRHLFAALLAIGGNRELTRLFPAFALHILFAQYRGAALRRQRLDDIRAIVAAIVAKDAHAAGKASRGHVEAIRAAVRAHADDAEG